MKSSISETRSPVYYSNTKVIKGGEAIIKPNDFRERSSVMRSDATAKKVATVSSSLEKKQSSRDINESADAFIKKFRQQLVIQRLESIENYEKMLARGT